VPLWLRFRLLRRRVAEGVEVTLGEEGERVEQALLLRAALRDLPPALGSYSARDGILYRDDRAVARAEPELAAELADLLNRQEADDAAQPKRRRWATRS
jgi:hypothetical protein